MNTTSPNHPENNKENAERAQIENMFISNYLDEEFHLIKDRGFDTKQELIEYAGKENAEVLMKKVNQRLQRVMDFLGIPQN